MEIIFVLIPLSVLLLAIAVGIFIWAVNNGQFDDMDSPAWKILVEDRKRDGQSREDIRADVDERQ